MIYKTIAAALLIAPTAGFQPAPAFATPLHASRSNVADIAMVSSQEVFGQLYEASPPAQKTLQSLPPPVTKGAGAALLAVTGAAGFLLTPSRRIAVNVVGGLGTAAIGNIGRKRLTDERQKAAVPAVAALLAEGLPKVTPDALNAVMEEYDVPKKQFDQQLGELYLAFLSATLNSPVVQTAELSELHRLQALLKLTPTQTGTQVYAAARQLFSRHRAYLEDEEPNDSKKLLEKFVFLAERVLAKDDSPEGYRYESLRLQKLFSLSPVDWRVMAENAAIPFYQTALNSAVLEGKAATAEQLDAVRENLGITSGCAEGMHSEVYAKFANGLLAAGAITADGQAQLSATQALLGMDGEIAAKNLVALTTPLYSASAAEVIDEIAAATGDVDAASLGGKLSSRMGELMLDAATAHALEAEGLRTKGKALLDEALVLMRAQNTPQAILGVQSLVSYCERASNFMAAAGHVAAADGAAALPALFSGLTGGIKSSESLALYRVLLLSALEEMKISDVNRATLTTLRTILGLSDADEASVYQAAAGPMFRRAVTLAVGADGAALGNKADVDTAASDLALPASVTAGICVEVYTERLKTYVDGGKILSEEQAEKLEKMRAFLSIEAAEVYPIHEKLCSDSYLTSVKEVMGTTGIIPDEYWEGLTKLQQRLCISDDAAQAVFAQQVLGKMKSFGDDCVKALEDKAKAQQAQQESGKMNIEAESDLTGEITKLIQFAVESKALATKEVDGEEVEVIGANLAGAYEKATLKELYKQYVVDAFSGSSAAQNEKIFGNLNKLALILGLDAPTVVEIHNNIGAFIYRQYIGKALAKGPLTAQDNQFLASIKDSLGLKPAMCDELIRDCQMNKVSMMVEQMFESASVLADDVRKMRDAADTYDVDLVEDLQINQFRLERLFLCEVEDLVDSGELTPANLGAVEEPATQLHISEESATRMLEEVVVKRTSGGLLQAAADMRMGSGDRAVEEISRMLRFAALMADAQAKGVNVSEGERNELYTLYQASMLGTAGGMDAEAKERCELLRSVMGLAPVQV